MSIMIQSLNPVTLEPVWEGRLSLPGDLDAQLIDARQAFGHWRRQPFAVRADALRRYAKCLEAHRTELAHLITLEMGKPMPESMGEIQSAINKIEISIAAYAERCRDFGFSHPGAVGQVTHRPHGVVVVMGPFNFPLHLPNGHFVPALLAGNVVIFKPSELTPAIGVRIGELMQQAGLPTGVFQVALGGRDVGEYLAAHSEVDGVLFTGSLNVGLSLMATFAKTPGRMLALEMGGNNPMVIGTVSDTEHALSVLRQSAFLSTGQRCTCIRRIVAVNTPENRDLIASFVADSWQLTWGDPLSNPAPFLGPLVCVQARDHVLARQEAYLATGAKALLKAEQPTPHGAFITPGILEADGLIPDPDEEVFGPLVRVYWVSTFSDAIRKANDTRYGLAAGCLSDIPAEQDQFADAIRAGVIAINTPTTGASSQAPFGGVGHSGNLRPAAYYAADYCAYPMSALRRQV